MNSPSPDVVMYGGTGFVAGAAMRHWSQSSRTVYAADTPESLAALLASQSGPCSLIYCRWRTVPSTSSARIEWEQNLGELVMVLDVLARHPPRSVVFLSSAGTLHAADGGARFSETTPVHPQNSFGAGKAAAEAFLIAAAQEHGFGLYIVRAGPLYGPNQPSRPGFGFIVHLLHAARTGARVTLWDPDATRQYLYIDDLLDLLERCLERPLVAGTVMTLHAAGAEAIANRDLIERVERITGRRITVEHQDSPVRLGRHSAIDCRCAYELLGWTPKTALDEGLRRAWAAHPEHRSA